MRLFQLLYAMLLFFCGIFSAISVSQQQSTSPKYNETEAKTLVLIAAAAYSDKPLLCLNRALPAEEEWSIIESTSLICDLTRNRCANFVAKSDIVKKFIVAFRGTENKFQLITESWQSLMPDQPFFNIGMVNRYFLHGFNIIWPNVERLLQDPAFSAYGVTFTGHSLGGAFASLAAAQSALLNLRTSDQIKLITYGEPRVGDHAYAMYHNKAVPHSFRIVNEEDIVSHLPQCKKNKTHADRISKTCLPVATGTPYHHATEIWYPDGMHEGSRYTECKGEPVGEDFQCSDSLIFELYKYNTFIYDHRHYFGVRVKDFGKNGCVNPSTFRRPKIDQRNEDENNTQYQNSL